MSGIAKTVEIQPSIIPSQANIEPPKGIVGYEWQGVPIDVFRTFSTEMSTLPTKDIEKLRDITEWAKSKVGSEGSIGDVLQKISEVRQKLGSPALNDRSFSKVWEYVKLQKIADEAVKRQQAMFAPRLI